MLSASVLLNWIVFPTYSISATTHAGHRIKCPKVENFHLRRLWNMMRCFVIVWTYSGLARSEHRLVRREVFVARRVVSHTHGSLGHDWLSGGDKAAFLILYALLCAQFPPASRQSWMSDDTTFGRWGVACLSHVLHGVE